MANQTEFLKDVRAAVDHLFAHRRMLRKVSVRIGFWPEGMVISARLSMDVFGEGCEVVDSGHIETISWERLEVIDAAELIGIIDKLCAPAHELLRGEGSA